MSARVDVIQRFYNDSKTQTSRAKYVFPVPAGAAVCAFEMRTADRHIVTGEVKEKTHALAEHEDAIRSGKTTALLDWVSGDCTYAFSGDHVDHTMSLTGPQCLPSR